MDILISICLGIAIAFIIVFIQKSSLKSVVKQRAASCYIKKGSFKLNTSTDVFLYKRIEKTEKEKKE